MHVAKGRAISNATKIWLTRSGGCLLAHNGSQLDKRDLANVMDFISLNHADICEKWSEYFHGGLAFYR